MDEDARSRIADQSLDPDQEMLLNHPLFMDGNPSNPIQAATIRAFAALSVGLLPVDTEDIALASNVRNHSTLNLFYHHTLHRHKTFDLLLPPVFTSIACIYTLTKQLSISR